MSSKRKKPSSQSAEKVPDNRIEEMGFEDSPVPSPHSSDDEEEEEVTVFSPTAASMVTTSVTTVNPYTSKGVRLFGL